MSRITYLPLGGVNGTYLAWLPQSARPMIRVERYRWLLTEATNETGGTSLTGLILDYGLEVIIYILPCAIPLGRAKEKKKAPINAQDSRGVGVSAWIITSKPPFPTPNDIIAKVLTAPTSSLIEAPICNTRAWRGGGVVVYLYFYLSPDLHT